MNDFFGSTDWLLFQSSFDSLTGVNLSISKVLDDGASLPKWSLSYMLGSLNEFTAIEAILSRLPGDGFKRFYINTQINTIFLKICNYLKGNLIPVQVILLLISFQNNPCWSLQNLLFYFNSYVFKSEWDIMLKVNKANLCTFVFLIKF